VYILLTYLITNYHVGIIKQLEQVHKILFSFYFFLLYFDLPSCRINALISYRNRKSDIQASLASEACRVGVVPEVESLRKQTPHDETNGKCWIQLRCLRNQFAMEILHSVVLICAVFTNLSFFSLASVDTPYKEFYFEQTIDHFNTYWKNYGKRTFMQRYLVQGERELWIK